MTIQHPPVWQIVYADGDIQRLNFAPRPAMLRDRPAKSIQYFDGAHWHRISLNPDRPQPTGTQIPIAHCRNRAPAKPRSAYRPMTPLDHLYRQILKSGRKRA